MNILISLDHSIMDNVVNRRCNSITLIPKKVIIYAKPCDFATVLLFVVSLRSKKDLHKINFKSQKKKFIEKKPGNKNFVNTIYLSPRTKFHWKKVLSFRFHGTFFLK